MSYEVECGECHEIILIEDLGVEVACPHCEAVLLLTEDDVRSSESADLEQPEPGPPADSPETRSSTKASDSTPNFDFLHKGGRENVLDEEESDVIPVAAFSINTGSPSSAVLVRAETDRQTDKETTENEPREADKNDGSDQELSSSLVTTSKPVQPCKSDTEPKSSSEASPSARRRKSFQERYFNILVSYSILITLVLFYLIFAVRSAKPHQLESLPDIAPPTDGQFMHYRENASLAPGHSLKLGETQRFGNIKVTPVKVSRAPIRFRHFQGDVRRSAPPTEPVLQLWLKIENVSTDQVFPPLDMKLIQLREYDREDIHKVYANNWITTRDNLPERSGRVFLYDHPPTSEYDIAGMKTGPINPGETIETFLPTQEQGLKSLTGELVWRFQIRKGFHPETMNGVTTLVEVLFHSNQIQSGKS